MKIIAITGTRADYGIFRPLLHELARDPQIDLKLVVTGMHILDEYGSTYKEIENDIFSIIAKPGILLKGDSTYAMSQMVGLGILYFADLFQYHQPDFVLLLGDRGEMLAAAICAHYQNIGMIHLHGGETSGSADDAIRHSISKLAHIHFVATEQAKQNLLTLGEEAWRIYPVGSLRKVDIQKLAKLDEETKQKWAEKYHLQEKRQRILLVMHPDSTDDVPFTKQIDSVLMAICALPQVQVLMIGANSDAGGQIFNKRLLHFASTHPNSSFFPSVPSDEYLYLLSKVDCLIGNSSSGIIEAPFFQLPAINIGKRQEHREQGGNVINVSYDDQEILQALKVVFAGNFSLTKANPYDLTENPEKEIARVIKTIRNDYSLRKKYLSSEK